MAAAGELMNGSKPDTSSAQRGSLTDGGRGAADKKTGGGSAANASTQQAVGTIEDFLKKFHDKLLKKREELPTLKAIYEVYKDLAKGIGINSLTMDPSDESRSVIAAMEHTCAALPHNAMSALLSHIPALALADIEPFSNMKILVRLLKQTVYSGGAHVSWYTMLQQEKKYERGREAQQAEINRKLDRANQLRGKRG